MSLILETVPFHDDAIPGELPTDSHETGGRALGATPPRTGYGLAAGRAVARRRAELGWTLKTLAQRCRAAGWRRVTRDRLRRLEAGECPRPPHIRAYKALSEVLRVDMEILFGFDPVAHARRVAEAQEKKAMVALGRAVRAATGVQSVEEWTAWYLTSGRGR